MGGKTAWGVSQDAISSAGDDPAALAAMQKGQKEFEMREKERLDRLKEMDKQAGDLLAQRQARKKDFEMGIIKGVDEFKKRQEEILERMNEAKERRRLEKLEAKKNAPPKAKKKGKEKKKKKEKEKQSESSGTASSSDSSDSSSESSEPEEKKRKLTKEEKKEAKKQ